METCMCCLWKYTKAVYFVREQTQALFFICSICDRSTLVTYSAKSMRTPYRSAPLIHENMVDLSSNQSNSILVGNTWENVERKKLPPTTENIKASTSSCLFGFQASSSARDCNAAVCKETSETETETGHIYSKQDTWTYLTVNDFKLHKCQEPLILSDIDMIFPSHFPTPSLTVTAYLTLKYV